jgi:hypothetical protein
MAILKVFMLDELEGGYVVLREEFSINQKKIPTMKTSRFASLLSVILLAVFSACSTPDSRIRANKAEFDALPAETQAKIREGKVEVGFTPSMVLMALGDPDRRYSKTGESGQSEVWAYQDKGPAFSFGVGVGGGSGRTGMGGGIGVSTAGDRTDDKLRVIFEGGRVVSIETRAR